MPPSLIKLFVTASASVPTASGTTVETTVTPAVTRFVATITAGMIGASNTVIPAASFVDDNGDGITNLPSPPSDGYISVYVNGVLQEGNLSTLTTTSLTLATIAAPAGVPAYWKFRTSPIRPLRFPSNLPSPLLFSIHIMFKTHWISRGLVCLFQIADLTLLVKPP